MTRTLVSILAVLLAATPTLGAAQDRTPLTGDELSELRGGYLMAAGVQLDFGAVVRTYVDGQLALESRLTWTETGRVTSQTGSLPGSVDLAGALDTALAQGLDLEALRGGEGLLLSDASGATALVHNIQNGGLQNLIVNNADGRDLRQEVEITLTLPNLETMQRGFAIEQLGGQISQDLNNVLQSFR